jgi:hypothetical protein
MLMAEPASDDLLSQVSALATDSFYVAVGFGVLGFQRLQVRRRELEAQLPPELVEVVKTVGERAQAVVVELVARGAELLNQDDGPGPERPH